MSEEIEVIGQLSQNCQHAVRIEWTIENIFSYNEVDKYHASHRFSFQNYRWRLRIYPYGEIDENAVGWIGLYLWPVDYQIGHRIPANVTFGVKMADGKVVNQRYGDLWDLYREDLNCSGHPKFMDRSELEASRSDLAPRDTLTLTCVLVLGDGPLAHSVQNTLSQNFADLFISKKGCDATLIVQKQEFQVHMCILGARSPVFAEMFQAESQKKQSYTADIEDCDPEVFKDFLLYLYSGKFECDSSKVFQLYKIAHKHDVGELVSACVLSMMYHHLTLETFFKTAVFANESCVDKLQQKTQLFFNDNFGKIIATTDWATFMQNSNTLADELLKNYVSDKKL